MRGFRIGLCGGHGTGKTTFAYELAAFLKKAGFDTGLSSNVSRSSRSGYLRGSFLNQNEILSSLMVNEQMLLEKHNVVICDRTVFDVQAYSDFYEGTEWTYDTMLRYIEEHGNYDFIVWFNKPFDAQDKDRNDMSSSQVISDASLAIVEFCLTNSLTKTELFVKSEWNNLALMLEIRSRIDVLTNEHEEQVEKLLKGIKEFKESK